MTDSFGFSDGNPAHPANRIELIKDEFDKYYRNTIIDENLEKVQYNVNFLSKLNL